MIQESAFRKERRFFFCKKVVEKNVHYYAWESENAKMRVDTFSQRKKKASHLRGFRQILLIEIIYFDKNICVYIYFDRGLFIIMNLIFGSLFVTVCVRIAMLWDFY